MLEFYADEASFILKYLVSLPLVLLEVLHKIFTYLASKYPYIYLATSLRSSTIQLPLRYCKPSSF